MRYVRSVIEVMLFAIAVPIAIVAIGIVLFGLAVALSLWAIALAGFLVSLIAGSGLCLCAFVIWPGMSGVKDIIKASTNEHAKEMARKLVVDERKEAA